MNTHFAKIVLHCTAAVLMAVTVSTSLLAQSSAPPASPSAASPSAASPSAASPSAATPSAESEQTRETAAASASGREARLAKYLSGAIFTGKFTVEGESMAPKSESYTILSCQPLETPDEYRLKVKIRYGDVDGEFPMDLRILWSGSTPVITLDGVWIPGLGTFSSRVLIHDGRYAGTWQHDAKGGHLFGTIKAAAE